MAAFNAELAAKALDKRLSSLENAIDAIQKQSRAAGDSVGALLALQKIAAEQKQRIDTLEKYVKTLMETRGESKQDALDKLRQTIVDIQTQQARDRERLQKARDDEGKLQKDLGIKDILRKDDVNKLIHEQVNKVWADLANNRKAESERAKAADLANEKALRERVMKEAQEFTSKAMADNVKAALQAEMVRLNARLTALESRTR